MSDPPRVVFDCNTLLQALARPAGPAGVCVQHAFDGNVALVISPVVIAELRDVAIRPKIAMKLGITLDALNMYCAALERVAICLNEVEPVFSFERDPDDAHYINLALAADAVVIVSRDRDLLDLMDANLPYARDFMARFPSLRIMDPPGLLEQLYVT